MDCALSRLISTRDTIEADIDIMGDALTFFWPISTILLSRCFEPLRVRFGEADEPDKWGSVGPGTTYEVNAEMSGNGDGSRAFCGF
jgi:hypothetical protein